MATTAEQDLTLRIVIARFADPTEELSKNLTDTRIIERVGTAANTAAMGLLLGLYIGKYHQDVVPEIKEMVCRLLAEAGSTPSIEMLERKFDELADAIAEAFR